MIEFKPMDNRVLIEPTDPSESAGGIILPDSVKDGRSYMGVVLAVGPGKPLDDWSVPTEAEGAKIGRRPMAVKPGDIVFYTNYGSHPMQYGGQEYRVAAEDDLLGYFPNPKKE